MQKNALGELVIFGLQMLLKYSPAAIEGIRELVAKNDPTDADFEAAKEKVNVDTYAALVPNSQLPPAPAAPLVP